MGLTFTSCQNEDLATEVETATVELKEPPFTNYLVITQSSELSEATRNFLEENGSLVSTLPDLGIAIVNSNDIEFAKNTQKNSEVLSVVPDYEIKWVPSATYYEEEYVQVGTETAAAENTVGENVYYMQRLWGMDAINAPEAWNSGFTGEGTSVFVLDSGIDAEHPDLSGNLNVELSESFIFNEEGKKEHWNIRPGFYFNHGTHVAGTIAATNDLRLIGVAPHAELVAVKVLSEYTGSGPFSAINAGIVYAADNGADVINLSLGVTFNKNGVLTDADGNQFKIPAKYIQEIILAQQRAVDYAFQKGSTIIASAGNDPVNYDGNKSETKLPGGLNNVITVSATAPQGYLAFPDVSFDFPASYTTYGRSLVDLAAPGGDVTYRYSNGDPYLNDAVWSTISNGWGWSVGTSMAAPHVSGVAALIIAKNGGSMDPSEVEKQLIKTADKVDGNGQTLYFGNGRVNAYRAVTE